MNCEVFLIDSSASSAYGGLPLRLRSGLRLVRDDKVIYNLRFAVRMGVEICVEGIG